MKMMNINEFKKICYKTGDYDSVVIKLTRKISPYISYALVKLGFSANETTIISMIIGAVGAVLLAFNNASLLIIGIIFLHLSNILDYCDGEIARYNFFINNNIKKNNSGAYLDRLWHYYIPTMVIFFIALGVFLLSGHLSVFVFGFFSLLGFCHFHFSCKEHMLIDYIRKFPSIVNNNDFKLATLDSVTICNTTNPRKNSLKSYFMRQLADWVYYPSFFNALTIIILLDITFDSFKFRYYYLILLSFIVTTHQIIKIRQIFNMLKHIQVGAEE